MILNIDELKFKTHKIGNRLSFDNDGQASFYKRICRICGLEFFYYTSGEIEPWYQEHNYSCDEYIIKNIIE